MEQEMQAPLETVESGNKSVRLSPHKLLAFNDYLATNGFSVSRMEAVKIAGERTGRRLDYDILANRAFEGAWEIFMDPERSRALVKEIVEEAMLEGGKFEFLVWAEEVPDWEDEP